MSNNTDFMLRGSLICTALCLPFLLLFEGPSVAGILGLPVLGFIIFATTASNA